MAKSANLLGRACRRTSSTPRLKGSLSARLLIFLAVLACCGTAWADIEVAPQYEPNTPIVATVTITDVPQGAKLRGSFAVSDGSYLPAGENVYHVWAGPGVHKITAQGVWVLTEDVTIGERTVPVLVDFGQFNYSRSFTVGPEVPTPDPFPQPTGPYQLLLLYDADQLDNLPAPQRSLLTSLAYRQKLVAAGHSVLGVLALQEVPAGSKYKAFFDSVQGDPMPRIAIAPLAGGKVTDFPLPATWAELETLLAKGVGR